MIPPTPSPPEAADPARPPTRLPALGRRGGGWVALQVALFAGVAAAGLLGPAWPTVARPWLWVGGGLVLAAGVGLLVLGGAGLGPQLTPFPRPTTGGELRQDRVYGLVRHPIYGGVLLIMLGWALICSPMVLPALALGAGFFDAKRRREEAWLLEHYPDYDGYRERVRKRFIPYVW